MITAADTHVTAAAAAAAAADIVVFAERYAIVRSSLKF